MSVMDYVDYVTQTVLPSVATVASWLACTVIGGTVLYELVQPSLQRRAKLAMHQHFSDAGLVIGRDVIVHDEGVYVEWMRNGTAALGQTYVTKRWDAGQLGLEEVLHRLMSHPDAEQDGPSEQTGSAVLPHF